MSLRDRAVLSPSGCLEWVGAKHRQGYGQLRVGGRSRLAHRAAWEEANGPIPEGMHVCHRARLSEADVSLIKLLVELGVRQRRLAALFGVSQTMVSRISLGKAWAGVAALEAA